MRIFVSFYVRARIQLIKNFQRNTSNSISITRHVTYDRSFLCLLIKQPEMYCDMFHIHLKIAVFGWKMDLFCYFEIQAFMNFKGLSVLITFVIFSKPMNKSLFNI